MVARPMEDFEFVVGEKQGSRVFGFPSRHFSIGSGPACELRLESMMAKANHAEVFQETDGTWWIRDVSGSGSVWVNGVASLESRIDAGCFLKVGRVELSVRSVGKSGPHGTLSTPTPLRSAATGSPGASARRPSGVGNSSEAVGEPRADPSGELHPGSIIDGRYRIVGKLAAGGMGEVYKAEHIELGKSFAIKVMLPALSNDPEFVTRFKREAIASSRIGQQNIVDISDFGRTAEGRFFFVMEFIEGRTLSSLVRHQGALPMIRVVQIGLQVARALAAAHQQSIVHRDLKPENVMLLQRPGQADFVKVLDFGIAKVSTGHGAGGQTAVGMVVGTPQYMSPEQASGLTVDPRTDIYSLGLILYELVTGRPTFQGQTPSILMALQMTAAPPPLAPGPVTLPVPDDLESLIFHMLAKKPGDRPVSMEEVIARLDQNLHQLRTHAPTEVKLNHASALTPLLPTQLPVSAETRARPPTGPVPLTAPALEPARNRMPLFVGLAALLLLLGIGGTVLLTGKGGEQPASALVEPPPPAPAPVVIKDPVPSPTPVVRPVKLTFQSVPDRANVFDGDVQLGTTPFALNREKGQVSELRFELKGYKPLNRKVRFEEETTIAIELEKLAPAAVNKPRPKALHDDPYTDVKDLKDAPY
jgi:serine/threonine protein kinase